MSKKQQEAQKCKNPFFFIVSTEYFLECLNAVDKNINLMRKNKDVAV